MVNLWISDRVFYRKISMKRIVCYLRTLKDWRIVVMAFWEFNAIYVAHDYYEQKSYIKRSKLYESLKCKTCGNISVGWRQL